MLALFNGNITTYTYDSLNRLTVLETKDTTDTIIVRYAYTLAPTGHRTQVTDHSGATTSYSYDDLYRLTGEGFTQHPALGSQSNSYEYDPVGNRTYSIENGIHTAYSYDANDRLLTAGGEDYAYDANGNTVTVAIDNTLTTYDYDANNRLIRMIKTENGIETDDVSYQYDIDGLRVAKNDDGQITTYLVDKNRDYGQVLHELDNNNQSTVSYLYGDDLIRQSRAANDSYYLYDGLGSTRALSDAAGAVTDTYTYDAYGTLIDSTGVTENSYLYTGEQFDDSLNNYYLRARYYDPFVGRFTQMDTWMGNSSDPVTLHKYAYGNLDPANTVDPSGHFGLVEFGVANNIRMELSSIQVDIGFSLLDSAFSDGEASATNGFAVLGLATIGGAGAFKLLRMMSNKFRSTCNSFSGDTLISTEEGLKPISEIEIGEKVWAYNEDSGELELQGVVHLIQREGKKEVVDITLETSEVIRTTEDPPFYVKYNGWQWLSANQLAARDQLYSIDDKIVHVKSVKSRTTVIPVFNLTIDKAHTYFVSVEKILSHNSSVCNPFGPFPNQLMGNLQAELATAKALNVSPVLANSSKFDEIVNSGETVKWAISTTGELRFVPAFKNGIQISHVVIHGGRDVIAAGEASIVSLGNGKYIATHFSNRSGHYLPSPTSAEAGRQMFKKYGIDVPGNSVELIQ